MSDFDVILSLLADQYIPAINRGLWEFAKKSPQLEKPLQAYEMITEGQTAPELLEPSPMAGAVEEAFRRREKEKEEEAKRKKGAEEIEGLRRRAKEYQKMTATKEYTGIPGTGAYMATMPEDKLRAIREQALTRGRTSDSLKEELLSKPRQGGTFSVAPDSPEIQMRLAERDKWLQEEHPMSMAAFMLTPEQVERRPQGIDAAEQLRGLAEERRMQNQQEMTNQIIQMIGDSKGRIPFERANQLSALGFPVPVRAIGASREEAIQFLDAQIMAAAKDMETVDPYDFTGVGRVVQQFSRAAQLFAEQLKQRVLAGEISADDAMEAFWNYASQNAMQLGFLQGPPQDTEQQPTKD